MPVEQLAEVGLAQPAVDARADLDADRRGHDGRTAEALREIDLPEAALADQPLDAIAQLRFRAFNHLPGLQPRGGERPANRPGVTRPVVAADEWRITPA